MGAHQDCEWDCGGTDCPAQVYVDWTATQLDPHRLAKDTVEWFAGVELFADG